MSNKEFKKMTVSQLHEELQGLLRKQFNLRVRKATQQLKQSHLLKETRRNIARIKTILNAENKGGSDE